MKGESYSFIFNEVDYLLMQRCCSLFNVTVPTVVPVTRRNNKNTFIPDFTAVSVSFSSPVLQNSPVEGSSLGSLGGKESNIQGQINIELLTKVLKY